MQAGSRLWHPLSGARAGCSARLRGCQKRVTREPGRVCKQPPRSEMQEAAARRQINAATARVAVCLPSGPRAQSMQDAGAPPQACRGHATPGAQERQRASVVGGLSEPGARCVLCVLYTQEKTRTQACTGQCGQLFRLCLPLSIQAVPATVYSGCACHCLTRLCLPLSVRVAQEKHPSPAYRLRGDINMLLLGDPGVAKSQVGRTPGLRGACLCRVCTADPGVARSRVGKTSGLRSACLYHPGS